MVQNRDKVIKSFVASVRASHGEAVARSCEQLISEASPTESISPMSILAQAISANNIIRDIDEKQLADVSFESSFSSKYSDKSHGRENKRAK